MPETARGRRTRARLFDAAGAVFGDFGYEAASVTAITRRAGVAQGTFYKYFPSKHAIFVELVAEWAIEMRKHLAAASTPLAGGPRAELERAALKAFFEFARDKPGLYAVVREAQFVAPASYRSWYEGFVKGYVSHLEIDVIDAETIGWMMAGAADMLGLRWVVWENRLPPDDVLDQVRDLLDAGFRGLATSEA